MKKKIAILGSTGSIGSTTLKIILKNKNFFQIDLLSTNKNINRLKKQVRIFKVKNVIIYDSKKFNQNKLFFKRKKIFLSK